LAWVTVEDRKHGFPRVDALRQTPARIRFLSCEPLLEDLRDIDLAGIDWAIVGGESGAEARKFDLEWARAIKARCAHSSAKFFFKQLGSAPVQDGTPFPILERMPNGKRDTSGTNRANFPADLNIQLWPSISRVK
jgi:protein gp37